MADSIVRFVVSSICLAGHLFVSYCFHLVEKACIIEVGYRNKQPKIKKAKLLCKCMVNLRALTLIDLYKKAKINHKAVKIYFICNICLLIMAIISAILWLIMIITGQPVGKIIIWQLGFTQGVVLIWSGAHFVLDAQYSPSERKRRNIE